MTRRTILFIVAALWAGLGAWPAARAQGVTPAEVWVILGKTEGSHKDPKLASLRALHQPPFDTFTDQRLLSTTPLKLANDTPAEATLPNGRRLRLRLKGKNAEGRYRVQVSINRPGKKDYLPLMTVATAPGDLFFIAGQKHAGGTLIIGVRVGEAPGKAK